MIGQMLIEWQTQHALECEKEIQTLYKRRDFSRWPNGIFASTPFISPTDWYNQTQDFIGPLFIDTTLDKTHYRLKDATGLLLDGTYHVNPIKEGSAHTPQGIVDTFDGYKNALKNTLLNEFAIETPDNKIQEVTL